MTNGLVFNLAVDACLDRQVIAGVDRQFAIGLGIGCQQPCVFAGLQGNIPGSDQLRADLCFF
ncbi:hypothetical protein D3C81_1733210 [compost metagenome]